MGQSEKLVANHAAISANRAAISANHVAISSLFSSRMIGCAKKRRFATDFSGCPKIILDPLSAERQALPIERLRFRSLNRSVHVALP